MTSTRSIIREGTAPSLGFTERDRCFEATGRAKRLGCCVTRWPGGSVVLLDNPTSQSAGGRVHLRGQLRRHTQSGGTSEMGKFLSSPLRAGSGCNQTLNLPSQAMDGANLFRENPNGFPVPGVTSTPDNVVTIPFAYKRGGRCVVGHTLQDLLSPNCHLLQHR